MIDGILKTPQRRRTVLPELHDFFQDACPPDDWERVFELFLKRFAGLRLPIPGPVEVQQMFRDQAIIKRLERDSSAQSRIRILATHGEEGVTHAYLERLWRDCHGRELPAPIEDAQGRQPMLNRVRGLVQRYPHLKDDIVVMYGLRADERKEL